MNRSMLIEAIDGHITVKYFHGLSVAVKAMRERFKAVAGYSEEELNEYLMYDDFASLDYENNSMSYLDEGTCNEYGWKAVRIDNPVTF